MKSDSASNITSVYEDQVVLAKYANSNFKSQENTSELKQSTSFWNKPNNQTKPVYPPTCHCSILCNTPPSGLEEFSSVQSLSHDRLFATPWTAAPQASLFITNSWNLLKLMSFELVMPSNHLSSYSPPTFNLSQHQGLFQWVSSSHQVDKVLEYQLQHRSFQWIFRTDFL